MLDMTGWEWIPACARMTIRGGGEGNDNKKVEMVDYWGGMIEKLMMLI